MALRGAPDAGHPHQRAAGRRACWGSLTPGGAAYSRDEGSSTVEFTLVSVLLVGLLLSVLQLGFVLHTRNVLVAAAQEGARLGANADRDASDARARTRAVVSTALSSDIADRMTYDARPVLVGGVVTMQVTVSGPLPLVLLPAGPLRLRVRGHALEEAALEGAG